MARSPQEPPDRPLRRLCASCTPRDSSSPCKLSAGARRRSTGLPGRDPQGRELGEACRLDSDRLRARVRLAWRVWRVDPAELRSTPRSPQSSDEWPRRGPVVASCPRGHEAPARGCTCGVYASVGAPTSNVIGRDRVAGRVLLHGRIEPGLWRGDVRAGRATLLDLVVPTPLADVADRLHGVYAVPVEVEGSFTVGRR